MKIGCLISVVVIAGCVSWVRSTLQSVTEEKERQLRNEESSRIVYRELANSFSEQVTTPPRMPIGAPSRFATPMVVCRSSTGEISFRPKAKTTFRRLFWWAPFLGEDQKMCVHIYPPVDTIRTVALIETKRGKSWGEYTSLPVSHLQPRHIRERHEVYEFHDAIAIAWVFDVDRQRLIGRKEFTVKPDIAWRRPPVPYDDAVDAAHAWLDAHTGCQERDAPGRQR